MGKFIPEKVREYNFVSLEDFVCDVVKEFDSIANKDDDDNLSSIGFVVTTDEAKELIPALFATGKFIPTYLDFDDIDYCSEYYISLLSDGSFWVEKSWSEEHNKYSPIIGDNVIFVSENISQNYFNVINDDENFIVLYDIEE